MELIYAIADELGYPNEWVVIKVASGNLVWFSIKNLNYTCKTVRNGKYLKKNSIRVDQWEAV